MRTALCCAVCFLLTLASHATAAEVQWKMHTINAASEFPACAAFDVDHDGDIDIYSGGWWYEAPTWKKHKVRDVPMIRGRYDDYSNQAMDCNGDGWTDIISVNYRSETIYWIEHPGKKLGEQDWAVHVIDKPGPSETGRLHDIDGDGDLDILPNGTTYAAWYEFAPDRSAGVPPAADGERDARAPWIPKWIKHDLPPEAAGHGIGFGFGFGAMNRDMLHTGDASWIVTRSALYFPSGESYSNSTSLEACVRPSIPHRDASVPILWADLNRDRHVDLIWGRGHSTGVYWSRRLPKAAACWTFAAIDTSWSQCHAPLLADIDSDGALDLVAGKRYMGHEGKDPGEYDPLVIYWYRYDDDRMTWQRHVIQENGPAGIDLDPAVVDVDADGDLDLVAPSRNGLYLFENLLINKQNLQPTTCDDGPVLATYKDHSQLLVYADRAGDLRPVKTPGEWGQRRWHVLRSLEQAMGLLPSSEARSPQLDIRRMAEHREAKYTSFRVEMKSHAADPALLIATLLVPKGREGRPTGTLAKPSPAMLCLHPTAIKEGKQIATGEVAKPNRGYAHELAERGYLCICPDYPTMGENAFDLQTHKHYQSGTMKAIWDNIRCLDVLESMPEVDPDRIGVIGHSLGGHNGLFTACFDQRIKCVVTSCGFTPFHDYYGGNLKGWTQDRYMPRIRDVYDSNPDKMPFDFYEVLGAIAPRGVFINAPLHDDNFEVGGVKKAVAEAQKVYDLLGKSKSLQARYPDCGHDFPEEVREEVYRWLDEQLKK